MSTRRMRRGIPYSLEKRRVPSRCRSSLKRSLHTLHYLMNIPPSPQNPGSHDSIPSLTMCMGDRSLHMQTGRPEPQYPMRRSAQSQISSPGKIRAPGRNVLTTGRAHSRRPIGCGIFSRARGERLRRRLAAGRRGVGFVPHVPGRGGRGAWREGGREGGKGLDWMLCYWWV